MFVSAQLLALYQSYSAQKEIWLTSYQLRLQRVRRRPRDLRATYMAGSNRRRPRDLVYTDR